MRTRRQDKAAAAAAAAAEAEAEAVAAVPAEQEEAPSTTVSLTTDSDTKDKDAQTSPATVTISKIEGPTVHRKESTPRSKLPTPVQFPLVAIISLVISELGYSVSWPFTQGVLATHARLPGTWPEVAAIMGWRLYVSPVPLLLQRKLFAHRVAIHAPC